MQFSENAKNMLMVEQGKVFSKVLSERKYCLTSKFMQLLTMCLCVLVGVREQLLTCLTCMNCSFLLPRVKSKTTDCI